MDPANLCLMALLALDSALCVCWCAAAALRLFPGWPGAAVCATLTLLCGGCWLLGRRFAPPPDWTNCFSSDDSDAEGPGKWQVCLIPGCSCVAALFGLLTIRAQTAAGLCALVLLALLLGVGTAFCVLLTIRYGMEMRDNREAARYREEMNSFLSVIRSQRHDYNFHVQTLAEMIHRGDLAECARYVDALTEDSIRINAVLPVQDAAVSAMINSFRVLAAREGIAVHLDIQNDLSQVTTNAYETNKVISNLLQNALDEVRTHEDKSYGIRMQVVKRGEYCVVRVSNELAATDAGRYVEDVFRQGYTTKTGHDGVGLASVKQLLRRHRGVVYSQVESGVIHFIAKIPLIC